MCYPNGKTCNKERDDSSALVKAVLRDLDQTFPQAPDAASANYVVVGRFGVDEPFAFRDDTVRLTINAAILRSLWLAIPVNLEKQLTKRNHKGERMRLRLLDHPGILLQ